MAGIGRLAEPRWAMQKKPVLENGGPGGRRNFMAHNGCTLLLDRNLQPALAVKKLVRLRMWQKGAKCSGKGWPALGA